MDNFTEKEIMEMIQKDNAPRENKTETSKKLNSNENIRNLLIVGCGDGGCHIASDIGKAMSDSFIIAYNTSERTINDIQADIRILADGQDGSGKVRDFSKDIFKQNSYKYLLDKVKEACNETVYEYIFVCSTADGGTGSGMSPMAAKMLADNTDIPVILLGVYPSLNDDATAQFNAMQWQVECTKIGLPYMIYDNNQNGSKKEVHEQVNTQISNMARLISGNLYGNHVVSIIDNRDMYMLLQHVGGRIVCGTSTIRPTTNETLDEYVEKMITTNCQPLPANIGGIGIFLKGPKDIIDRLDPSIPNIRDKYGDAAVHYQHIEYDNELRISFIFSGNDEPEERLFKMKDRYDYVMSNQKSKAIFSDMMSEQMGNPLGLLKDKKLKNEIDLSALDI
jgi:hypothetical protein